jgi:hypothetical protein
VNVFDAAAALGLAALAAEDVARPVSAAAARFDAGLYVPIGDHIAGAKDHGASILSPFATILSFPPLKGLCNSIATGAGAFIYRSPKNGQ